MKSKHEKRYHRVWNKVCIKLFDVQNEQLNPVYSDLMHNDIISHSFEKSNEPRISKYSIQNESLEHLPIQNIIRC